MDRTCRSRRGMIQRCRDHAGSGKSPEQDLPK
jgi:hypothetical protein